MVVQPQPRAGASSRSSSRSSRSPSLRPARRAVHRGAPGLRLRGRDPRALPLRPHAAEPRQEAASADAAADPEVARRLGVARSSRGLLSRALRCSGSACRAARLAARPVAARTRSAALGAAALLGLPPRLRGALGPAPRGRWSAPSSWPEREKRVMTGVDPAAPTSCLVVGGALLRSASRARSCGATRIPIFLSIELMMNAANLALFGYGARARRPREGQIVVFFVIAVAAAEAAVGLAIFVALFRAHRDDRRGQDQPAEVVRRDDRMTSCRSGSSRRSPLAGFARQRRCSGTRLGKSVRHGRRRRRPSASRRSPPSRALVPYVLGRPRHRSSSPSASWIAAGDFSRRPRVPARPALGADARRSSRSSAFLIHVYSSATCTTRTTRLRALLRVPEPLHVRDAHARPRGEPPRCSSSAGRASASARTC